jgi:hypothetical protein
MRTENGVEGEEAAVRSLLWIAATLMVVAAVMLVVDVGAAALWIAVITAWIAVVVIVQTRAHDGVHS